MSPGEQIEVMLRTPPTDPIGPVGALGIKPRIEHLKVGESSIIGPYLEPKSCATTICRVREDHPEMAFKQRKMLLVDPTTCETFPVYLVTRIAREGC